MQDTIPLRLLNFLITLLLRPSSSDFNLRHSSIFCRSTVASILSKTCNAVFSKSNCSILWGITEISIHSLREYCSFSQHFRSSLATWSTSLLLTFLEISRSESSFVNLFFKSSSSEFILFSTVSKLFWKSITDLAKSDFHNFSRDARVWAIIFQIGTINTK